MLRHLRLEGPARRVISLGRRAKRFADRTAEPFTRAFSAARSQLALGRLALAYRRTLSAEPRFRVLSGAVEHDAIAIVVCLWRRPLRIHDILRIADEQAGDSAVRLVLWNNAPEYSAYYEDVIAGRKAHGALASVELHTSRTNVGGVGRFIAIRELLRTGYSGPVIMMDDDQDFGPGFVSDLLREYGPRTIAGVWAWQTNGSYWNRTQVHSAGTPVNHIGTGGCVCDSELMSCDAFFKIPARFLFMEDIWMTHLAARSGWALKAASSPVTFVLAELDQGHAIVDRKQEFFEWLQVSGNVPRLAEIAGPCP